MKMYFALLKMRFRNELAYVGAAIGGLVCQCFFGFILIALYRALNAGKMDTVPIASTVTYVWIQQAFFRMLFSYSDDLSTKIINGTMAYDMCRPVDLYTMYFFDEFAWRSSNSILRAVPMILIAMLLPEGWRMSLPADIFAFIGFIVCMVLGLLCTCAVGNIMNVVVMMTLDTRGISALIQLTIVTFSGNLLPLTLYPDSWQFIVKLLPFSQLLDAPIRVYTGETNGMDFHLVIAVQLIWIIVLWSVGRYMWTRQLRKLTVQGG